MSLLQTLFYTVGILFFITSIFIILFLLVAIILFWRKLKDGISNFGNAEWLAKKLLAIKKNPTPFLASLLALFFSAILKRKKKA